MNTQSLTDLYQKAKTAKGITKVEVPTVRATQSTCFRGWEVRVEVSSALGVERHMGYIKWYNHDLISVNGSNHDEVVRLLKEHLSRLDGYLDMLSFVSSLDPSYRPE